VRALQFLCSVITQSVIAAAAASDSSARSLGAATHVKWPQLVLKLAPLLGVSVDFLMRHYVVELYCSGLDTVAQEVGERYALLLALHFALLQAMIAVELVFVVVVVNQMLLSLNAHTVIVYCVLHCTAVA